MCNKEEGWNHLLRCEEKKLGHFVCKFYACRLGYQGENFCIGIHFSDVGNFVLKCDVIG